MTAAKWIKEAQSAGWRVTSAKDRTIRMQCAKQGCPGVLSLPIDNLGPTPATYDLPHVGQYGAPAYNQYKALVAQLVRKRRALGMSQEDINAAAGMAEAHLNKLESFARTAQFSTMQLWAETLGLAITLAPSSIPAATARAIETRVAQPLCEAKSHYKHDAPTALQLSHDR